MGKLPRHFHPHKDRLAADQVFEAKCPRRGEVRDEREESRSLASLTTAVMFRVRDLGHSAAQERGDVVHDDDHDEHDQDLGSESARECPFRSAMLLIVESAGTQIPALYVVRRPFESANEMHCGTLDQARHWSYS
jgi:hypothetical protein